MTKYILFVLLLLTGCSKDKEPSFTNYENSAGINHPMENEHLDLSQYQKIITLPEVLPKNQDSNFPELNEVMRVGSFSVMKMYHSVDLATS